mmetsp:Transcript_47621/g.132799  ORF Transcript_47621/g.132799 Transcript_47621/m.132799 type:complete len:325 (+) Transcript_47621:300-1274(+)
MTGPSFSRKSISSKPDRALSFSCIFRHFAWSHACCSQISVPSCSCMFSNICLKMSKACAPGSLSRSLSTSFHHSCHDQPMRDQPHGEIFGCGNQLKRAQDSTRRSSAFNSAESRICAIQVPKVSSMVFTFTRCARESQANTSPTRFALLAPSTIKSNSKRTRGAPTSCRFSLRTGSCSHAISQWVALSATSNIDFANHLRFSTWIVSPRRIGRESCTPRSNSKTLWMFSSSGCFRFSLDAGSGFGSGGAVSGSGFAASLDVAGSVSYLSSTPKESPLYLWQRFHSPVLSTNAMSRSASRCCAALASGWSHLHASPYQHSPVFIK